MKEGRKEGIHALATRSTIIEGREDNEEKRRKKDVFDHLFDRRLEGAYYLSISS